MAKYISTRGLGNAWRWSRGSMKFGQSWDAEAQALHNRNLKSNASAESLPHQKSPSTKH